MSVRIITDSGFDIPGEASADPRLTVLPLGITFGETTYADGVDLTNDRFYELLVESDELPKTSQATPYQYAQVFEQVRAAGDEAVVVTLSSALSGTWQSAVTAAADFDEVHVVDGKNATIGQGVLVLLALRLADEGLDAAAIAARLEEERERVCLVALLDTLEYLKRGGRIPKSVGTIGELLNIKPVVGVRDGEVVMFGKARGSKNGRNLLHQEVDKSGIDFGMPVLLGYTGLSDKLLRKYLEDNRAIWEGRIAEKDLPITSVGATIGTHVGPNAIALAFFRAH
ncbi:DegV family protein [Thermophilibacter sp.]